jgi:CDP-paratose 2-epimerase
VSVAIITGSCGLVGSEAAQHFSSLGLEIVGIDNDLRAELFGVEASTLWMREELEHRIPRYQHNSIDLRDLPEIHRVFRRYERDISLVIHAAAQPSHDWAAKNPSIDFNVNALGTSILLEATRTWAPEAVFIFLSTNKVYGDMPNYLPLIEHPSRWEIATTHQFYEKGISEELSIDDSMHSLFGASKLAADLLVQEYRQYFGMRTGCFRCGCISGPNHSGAQLHGFLSYMMLCAVQAKPYTIYGYHGKQVRDNLHSADLMEAFAEFFADPDRDAEDVGCVYNMGGGRDSSCSVVEALQLCQQITGHELVTSYAEPRRGDHIWWITDTSRFRERYPRWRVRHDSRAILEEIFCSNQKRWECRQ